MAKTKGLRYVGLLLFVFMVGAFMSACARYHEIRILHVNDFHGFAMPFRPYGSEEYQGGLAFLASRVDELREQKPTLLLAAGDMIQGNNWANMFQGKSSIEAMNALGFDAMVVGNHEFDFGQQVLKERIEQAHFPILGANVTGIDGLKPWTAKTVDGVKVALIGVVTADTPVTTHPRNVSGLQFANPEDTVRHYVRMVREQNDLIVILSHLGFHGDTELARKVEGIDVIVGGHSHTKVEKPFLAGTTAIVQAFEHGKALGVLDVVLRNGRIVRVDGRLEPIRPVGEAHAAVGSIVAKYQHQVDGVMNQQVGEAREDLDGANVRSRETNLGNFITDIMRETAGADAAIINGGTIRTSIKKGPIKVADIYGVVPFDNYIVAIRLKGSQIRDTLEHGVSAVEEGEGRFPQVSGLTFTYDGKAPKGSRVKEVYVNGSPLRDDREYTVATNDFLAAGGDGYTAFGDSVKSSKDYAVIGGAMKGERLVYNDAGRWLRDVIMDSIRKQGQISPRVEGRIQEIKR